MCIWKQREGGRTDGRGRASLARTRTAIVFFRQDLLGFGVVEAEFKAHVAFSSPPLRREMPFQYHLDPQSWHWGENTEEGLRRCCSPSEPITLSVVLVAQNERAE